VRKRANIDPRRMMATIHRKYCKNVCSKVVWQPIQSKCTFRSKLEAEEVINT
jgi:hypothetical protein